MEAAGWGRWPSHTVQSSPVMDVDGGGLPDGWNVTACARGWSQAGESLHHGRLGASPTRQRGGFGEAWRDRSAAGVGRSTENRRTRAGPNVAPGTWAALEGMRILALAGTSVSGRPTTCCMQRREFGWQPQVRVETGPPAGQEDEAHRARRSSRSSRPSVTPIRLIAHHVSSVSQTHRQRTARRELEGPRARGDVASTACASLVCMYGRVQACRAAVVMPPDTRQAGQWPLWGVMESPRDAPHALYSQPAPSAVACFASVAVTVSLPGSPTLERSTVPQIPSPHVAQQTCEPRAFSSHHRGRIAISSAAARCLHRMYEVRTRDMRGYI